MRKLLLLITLIAAGLSTQAQNNFQFIPSFAIGASEYGGTMQSYLYPTTSGVNFTVGGRIRFGANHRHLQFGGGLAVYRVSGSSGYYGGPGWGYSYAYNDVFVMPHFYGAYKFYVEGESYIYAGGNVGYAFNTEGYYGYNEINGNIGADLGFVFPVNNILDLEISEGFSYLNGLNSTPTDAFTGERYTVNTFMFVTNIGIRLNKR